MKYFGLRHVNVQKSQVDQGAQSFETDQAGDVIITLLENINYFEQGSIGLLQVNFHGVQVDQGAQPFETD